MAGDGLRSRWSRRLDEVTLGQISAIPPQLSPGERISTGASS